jgi:hypothetical protein
VLAAADALAAAGDRLLRGERDRLAAGGAVEAPDLPRRVGGLVEWRVLKRRR